MTMTQQTATAELVEATEGLLRIIEAVRYTAGLGKHQMERVERAKKAIASVRSAGGEPERAKEE